MWCNIVKSTETNKLKHLLQYRLSSEGLEYAGMQNFDMKTSECI